MLLIVHRCFLTMLSRKIIVRKTTLQTTNKFFSLFCLLFLSSLLTKIGLFLYRDPTPTPFRGVKWPSVSSSDNREYVEINRDGLHVKQSLLKERATLWESLQLKMPKRAANGQL